MTDQPHTPCGHRLVVAVVVASALYAVTALPAAPTNACALGVGCHPPHIPIGDGREVAPRGKHLRGHALVSGTAVRRSVPLRRPHLTFGPVIPAPNGLNGATIVRRSVAGVSGHADPGSARHGP